MVVVAGAFVVVVLFIVVEVVAAGFFFDFGAVVPDEPTVVGGVVVGGVVVGGVVVDVPPPAAPAELTLLMPSDTGAVWNARTPARPAAVAEEKMIARFILGLSTKELSDWSTDQNAKASV